MADPTSLRALLVASWNAAKIQLRRPATSTEPALNAAVISGACLASAGGNLVEALRIAEDARRYLAAAIAIEAPSADAKRKTG